ncbi:MAG: cellulase family glycosylhydrolase [Gemmataceae bacterium]|nr:cellulase family glycosylhydrolase [Gemmataceae bacterium]
MPWIRVAKDGRTFVEENTFRRFTPLGFNYDHDEKGALIEDYWETDWPRVEEDFKEMKDLGANVVRIHLQFAKFMDAPERPNEKALKQLGKLVKLAEKARLYLNVTGLGCYHKKDVPAWYDRLSEQDRWDCQVDFWGSVADVCGTSPAIFCYDLMNEPVVPGGKRKAGDWLGPPFGGKHFVQFITLDQDKRPRPEIAQKWITHLVRAIRAWDLRHMITVGLVDWSLDRPGLTSGFVPDKIAGDLDFLCVHIYPKAKKVDEALATLKGFAAVGKPVVIEETFPLRCSMDEFGRFFEQSEKHAAGWIGFYWGKTPAELRRSTTIGDAMMLQWLEFFAKRSRKGD